MRVERTSPKPRSLSVSTDRAPAARFVDYLRAEAERIVEDGRAVDGIVRRANSGAAFNTEQLLRIQSTVYRYVHSVELASRLVDRLAGAAKQVLQSQQ